MIEREGVNSHTQNTLHRRKRALDTKSHNTKIMKISKDSRKCKRISRTRMRQQNINCLGTFNWNSCLRAGTSNGQYPWLEIDMGQWFLYLGIIKIKTSGVRCPELSLKHKFKYC